MRVALDFYRILMVPLQSEAGGLESAYRERLAQELWRGFSTQALTSRRQLLDESYTVLSDPAQRAEYDTHLKAVNPSLDLLPQQTAGALIVLCELGDYEGAIAGAESALSLDATNGDYILTRAIARLALARDLWQQRDYEGAATLLHRANDELMQHHSFPEMQAEIRSDLNQLRPYRILELLAHSSLNAPERQEGLRLLRALLDERMGIEGKGADGSGLTMEDALRFIQKARSHMTLSEQHELFEIEADRPSLVAAYLAAYALIARGYVERRPLLLRRARGRLVKLVQRHDVYLEQAICTLLLGQPDEALRLMRLSQDRKAARAIKDLSGDREDLLLGLCRYIERWFRREVFPEYRDLDAAGASLNAYFEDPQVQAYLEAMPTSAEVAEQFDRQPTVPVALSPNARTNGAAAQVTPTETAQRQKQAAVATESRGLSQSREMAVGTTAIGTSAAVATTVASRQGVTAETVGRGTQLEERAQPTGGSPLGVSPEFDRTTERNGFGRNGRSRFNGHASWTAAAPGSNGLLSEYVEPSAEDEALATQPLKTEASSRGWAGLVPSWLWKAGGVLLATALCIGAVRWYGKVDSESVTESDSASVTELQADGPTSSGSYTPERLDVSAFLDPESSAENIASTAPANPDAAELEALSNPETSSDIDTLLEASGPLSEASARAAVETWQQAKHDAMGAEYQSDALAEILVDPMLTNWQTRSRSYQQQGARMNYTLKGMDVQEVIPQGEDRASVVVQIDEARDYWVNDTKVDRYSSASVYRVRYDLMRRDGQWVISKYVLL
ncbi:MAG: IMS domain-containing protein [Cyanobacteria bacterium J06642_2]